MYVAPEPPVIIAQPVGGRSVPNKMMETYQPPVAQKGVSSTTVQDICSQFLQEEFGRLKDGISEIEMEEQKEGYVEGIAHEAAARQLLSILSLPLRSKLYELQLARKREMADA